jgi:hypothetical protein
MSGRGMRGDWVDFAAILLILSGTLDGLQGLIAIVRNGYFALTPDQILVVDLTTWGWIILWWGLLVALTGAGLWLRSSWARWVAIVVAVANVVVQLGFTGNNSYALWALTVIALNVVVLYGLTAHWHGAR